MISINANNGKISYGVKHYILDTQDDVKNLSHKTAATGSTAFVIDTSKYYMLNSNNEWIETNPYGKEVVYEGGSLDENTSDDNDKSEVVYEGGTV